MRHGRRKSEGGEHEAQQRIVNPTHAEFLSRPSDLIALNRARADRGNVDDGAYQKCLSTLLLPTVIRNSRTGVDVPDDGDFGKPIAANYEYCFW